MNQRKLGRYGPAVSAVGLGCMGMSTFYAGRDDQESVKTLHRAVELGVTLFDTSDMYGDGANELLLGRALKDVRSRALIATKFGQTRAADGTLAVNGRPEYVRAACEGSKPSAALRPKIGIGCLPPVNASRTFRAHSRFQGIP